MDETFASLFADKAPQLRRTAYLLCGDWNRAEDLVQTAFVKTFAARRRIAETGATEGYLRRTLVNAYIDGGKRRWRKEIPHAHHAMPDGSTAPDSNEVSDTRLMLQAALAAVPPRQRAVLVLRFFEDLSIEETADVLGCAIGTVKSNTARGLDALRAQLALTEPLRTTSR